MSENLPEIVGGDRGIVRVDPELAIEYGSRAAKALTGVVEKAKLSRKFGGDKAHIFFEGWQTVGQFYKATPKTEWTRTITDDKGQVIGFEARATVLQDGVEIGAAESSCMKDEANWRNKPMFQLRSMAQTRAMAKALRSCFAWVVVLAGYAATPAEEMDGIDEGKQEKAHHAPQEVPQSPQDSSVISDPQRKRFYAISKTSGATDDQIKAWLFTEYGWTSSREITRENYEEVCERVKQIGLEPGGEG